MHHHSLESLPTDIWIAILQHLDPAASALLALCNKSIYRAIDGPRILKDVHQDRKFQNCFLLLLERDLPLSHLYCPVDVRYHHVEVSSTPSQKPSDSVVKFPFTTNWWWCVREDDVNGIPTFLGKGLYLFQARMALKLFERGHPLAQQYLESFNTIEIKTKKPLEFAQRELKVGWLPGQERLSLFLRIQHWSYTEIPKDWRTKGIQPNEQQFPWLCCHNPRRPNSGKCRIHPLSTRNQVLVYCLYCGMEFRIDKVEINNPPRLYVSHYWPSLSPFSGYNRVAGALVFTKWMNLGSLDAQTSREWWNVTSDQPMPRLRAPRGAFEFFEGEDCVSLEREGKQGYIPVWTKELERKVKDALKHTKP